MKGAMVNGVEAGPVGAEIRDGVCRSGIVDEEAVFSSFSVIQPQDVAASRVPKPGTVPVLLSWIGHVAIAMGDAGINHEQAVRMTFRVQSKQLSCFMVACISQIDMLVSIPIYLVLKKRSGFLIRISRL